jgi:hypothetical protein
MQDIITKIKLALTDKHIITKNKLISELDTNTITLPYNISDYKTELILNTNIFNDIEYNSLIKEFTFKLIGGKHVLEFILHHPINDIDTLNKRKSIFQNLSIDNTVLEQLTKFENDILWIFKNQDRDIESIFNMVYFNFYFLKNFNKNASILTLYNFYRIYIAPSLGLLAPILYFIIPYFVIIYTFGFNMSFTQFIKLFFKILIMGESMFFNNTSQYIKILSYLLTLLCYFQGIFNTFEISKTIHKICRHIVTKMNNIHNYLKLSYELIKEFWNDDYILLFNLDPTLFINNTLEETYVTNFSNSKYNFGQQLKSYKFIDKNIIKSILYKSYVLDAFNSIIYFKNNKNYIHPIYLKSNIPYMNVQSIRHPCLKNPVSNDLLLRKNMILTAGNTAGKSVLLKSLLINVLFSQTITISCSTEFTMTPFYNIASQINVPDVTGYESLFEAELFRCKDNLDLLKSLENNKFSFIVMDEIFNSTNPYEGIAAAYSVCKKMGSYKNNILVFTTHYNYLTKLAKETPYFKNYKMEVLVDKEDIHFTYKLKKGVNKHYLALEILKKNGFDEDILDEALQLKNSLLI